MNAISLRVDCVPAGLVGPVVGAFGVDAATSARCQPFRHLAGQLHIKRSEGLLSPSPCTPRLKREEPRAPIATFIMKARLHLKHSSNEELLAPTAKLVMKARLHLKHSSNEELLAPTATFIMKARLHPKTQAMRKRSVLPRSLTRKPAHMLKIKQYPKEQPLSSHEAEHAHTAKARSKHDSNTCRA